MDLFSTYIQIDKNENLADSDTCPEPVIAILNP